MQPNTANGNGRLAPVPEPEPTTGVTDALPKLRVWATYPDGSSPESIEITYDGAAPVTVELIAGIVLALAPATATTHHFPSPIGQAPTRASDTAKNSLKGKIL